MALFQYGDKFTVTVANLIRKLWASASAPADPATGEIYLDINVSPPMLKRYNGATWDSIGSSGSIPVKASGAEIDGQTDDAKFATAKALADSTILLKRAWPIGCVFLSVVSTSPATLLGFGTWTKISQGQFLVGQKDGDSDFDTAEKTGGTKTHKHSIDPPDTTTGEPSIKNYQEGSGAASVPGENHTHQVNIAAFDSEVVSNVPPSFVAYVWKRTA